ncbi:hypothetical protein CWT12_08190 [Actinomyces sp. 432]|uniref:YveK family protein n=1 Tax=Actinomyces sp. 432 TaxID=2057798 RepID=UPI001373C1CF|nr:hypothetical protein [Actinomyces sp. 432]QHO91296.1 hypothetical protein CWT12_08190 [Actinomyces sp. 432]
MTLADILVLTRRWAAGLLVAALVGAGAGYALVRLTPVTYAATAIAYVRVEVVGDQNGSSSQYAAEQLAVSQAESLVPVVTSPVVAQAVARSLGIDAPPAALADTFSAKHVEGTHMLEVTARAGSAAEARQVADAAVGQAAVELENLEGAQYPAEVVLMSSAELDDVSHSPSAFRAVAAGAVAVPALVYALLLLAGAMGAARRGAAAGGRTGQEPGTTPADSHHP